MKNKLSKKIGIIVPTIREANIQKFLQFWSSDFKRSKHDIHLYIVEDNETQTFLINNNLSYKTKHISWKEIEKELGNSSWIIPRRSDAIRSFGVYMAYKDNCDYFITVDDDCYPYTDPEATTINFVDSHVQNLILCEVEESMWINSIKNYKPRGFPYGSLMVKKNYSNIGLSHGLWVNVPDFDGITSLTLDKKDNYFDHTFDQIIPSNKFYPMCSMNLAWRREITPIMYFLLMGKDKNENKYEFDRFGDIWCGLIVQKIMSNLDLVSVSGKPYIFHQKASDPYVNLIKEAPGIKINELFWRDIHNIELESNSLKEMYKEMANKLPKHGEYWDKLSRAMLVWISLF